MSCRVALGCGCPTCERAYDAAIDEAASIARRTLPIQAGARRIADRATVILKFHLGLLPMPSIVRH